MMWDLRGNDAAQDRRRSPNPRFPMPSPGIPPAAELHRSHDPFPKPFVPLGLPEVPRSASPNPRMYSRENLPSLIHEGFPSRGRPHPPPIPHATRPPPSPYMSRPPPHPLMSRRSTPPPPMPVPQFVSKLSNVQPSSKNNHTHTHTQSQSHRHGHHQHSHPTSAPTQTIRRTTSQQLRFAPPTQPSSASSTRNLHRSRSSQHLRPPTPHSGPSGHRHRSRVNSASSAHQPIIHPQQQVQPHVHQQVVHHNGHVHFQYSKCTGRKKALCIGINYKGQRRELRGCVNDAHNVKRFLTSNWGYKDGDIVMLVDDTDNLRQMPTRKNILDAMRWLVNDAHPHDALFFHYSGHGGQVPDQDGDEVDGLDEVIYPVDYKKAGMIVDDEMHRIMVKSLPTGCRLTAVFDSCHSGTALDLPYIYHSNGRLKGNHIARQAQAEKATNADVISFAGCRDDQTSADTTQGGMAVGAMSYAFVTSLTKQPVQSYQELLKSVRAILKNHYQQKPQLSSSHYIDTNLCFII
ncbi:caspase domain-containing protein [Suillus discolor]|uniref:Caspase domain-containing protein n=1 Tax=Suillus discolor TaxID=1912936 RepID=A0A9P7EY54_9AGAM|nr:caspase domain-containing protein [Suillus discolor]KAG2095488.1 caspase domain-containing protein [Suillus discolor]